MIKSTSEPTAVALDLKGFMMDGRDQKMKPRAVSYRGSGMESHAIKVTNISGVI